MTAKNQVNLIIDQKKILTTGTIYIVCSDNKIFFLNTSLAKARAFVRKHSYLPVKFTSNKFSKSVFRQLEQYLSGKRKKFSVATKLIGTDFQLKSWSLLQKISYSNRKTYSQLAELAGSPLARRAIGSAVGKNPVPIIIPCHRIVAQNNIGGFSLGLALKRKLLGLEKLHG